MPCPPSFKNEKNDGKTAAPPSGTRRRAGILHRPMACCKRRFSRLLPILTQQCPVSRGKGRLPRITFANEDSKAIIVAPVSGGQRERNHSDHHWRWCDRYRHSARPEHARRARPAAGTGGAGPRHELPLPRPAAQRAPGYAVSDSESARECIEENMILRRIGKQCVEETEGFFVRTKLDDPGLRTRLGRSLCPCGHLRRAHRCGRSTAAGAQPGSQYLFCLPRAGLLRRRLPSGLAQCPVCPALRR